MLLPVGDVKHHSLIRISRWFNLWDNLAFHSLVQNTTHTHAVTFLTGKEEIKSYFYFMILSHIVQCKSHGCQSKNNTRYLNTSFPLRSSKDFVAVWNPFRAILGEETHVTRWGFKTEHVSSISPTPIIRSGRASVCQFFALSNSLLSSAFSGPYCQLVKKGLPLKICYWLIRKRGR